MWKNDSDNNIRNSGLGIDLLYHIRSEYRLDVSEATLEMVPKLISHIYRRGVATRVGKSCNPS